MYFLSLSNAQNKYSLTQLYSFITIINVWLMCKHWELPALGFAHKVSHPRLEPAAQETVKQMCPSPTPSQRDPDPQVMSLPFLPQLNQVSFAVL